MDYDSCPCSGKNLNRLVQPAVMAILAKEPLLHGYLIVQRLSGMSLFKDQPPDPTGVYRLLKTMEKEGLVSCRWDLADSGPARRQFVLEPSGVECLARWTETLTLYAEAVSNLLGIIQDTGSRGAQPPGG